MDLRGLGTGTWKGFSDQELCNIKQTTPEKSPPSEQLHKVDTSTQLSTEQSPVVQDESCDQGTKSCDQETKSCDQEKSEPRSCDLVEVSVMLEEQQRRQWEMEAENKEKKKVLEEVLVQRYQESRAESSKLERVHSELRRLDQLVSRDVTILRDKIEVATHDFNHARSRFECAEKEYISAKLALAGSRERKELLSQHLCAVIQESESRKAAKLSDLMQEMNIKEPP